MKVKNIIVIIIIALLSLSATACNATETPQLTGPEQFPARQGNFQGRGDGQPGGQPPERFPAGGFGGGFFLDIVAQETGLDLETIQAQSAEGKTLAEIVTENGGDIEVVRAQLLEMFSTIPAPEGQGIDVEERVDSLLNNPLSGPGGGGFGPPRGNGQQGQRQ